MKRAAINRSFTHPVKHLVIAMLLTASGQVAAQDGTYLYTDRASAPSGTPITIFSGGCKSANDWYGIYPSWVNLSDPNQRRQHVRTGWCTAGSNTGAYPYAFNTAQSPLPAGQYVVRMYAPTGDWYTEFRSAATNFTVTAPSSRLCRSFTTTTRFNPITARIMLNSGLPIPSAAYAYLDVPITPVPAYIQVKGQWCYGGGNNKDQVISNSIQNVQGQATMSATNLQITLENLAKDNTITEYYSATATRYRIPQARGSLIFTSPAKVSFMIPGTSIGLEMPAGTRLNLGQVRTDTLLTGVGNASCATTGGQACEISLGTPFPAP
jgi:hypothetical protein